MKWSDLSLPWHACLEESWDAYCCGTVPIGAVIADQKGQVVCRGRNRICEQQAPPGQTCNSELAHAELNALLAIGPRPDAIHDYAIYTAVEPCPLCLGAIYMSGIRQIYFATEDAYGGSTNLLGKTWYLAHKPVKVFGPQRGGLAEFACALHIEFNLRRYSLPNMVIDMEREVFPLGVALGEQLFQQGLAQIWAAHGMGAALVFDQFQKEFRHDL